MSKFILMAAALLAVTASAVGQNAAKPARASRPPNIELILADDLGYKDGGFTGSDFHEAPHLLAWIERTGAKLPTEPNPKFDPQAKPGARPGPEVNEE